MSEETKQQCPQFHYFGAPYIDATCIDGYLWDLDSNEGEFLTKGGDDPCPFCNTEAVIENMMDDDESLTKEDAEKIINELRERYQ